MAESQELRNTLAAILANIQKLSEKNKVGGDEAVKQNKSLQSLHDENKKIYTAVHDPVSYTHLDVYKRQTYNDGSIKCCIK